MGGKGSGIYIRIKKLPCKWNTFSKCYAFKCIYPDKVCPAKDENFRPRYGKINYKERRNLYEL